VQGIRNAVAAGLIVSVNTPLCTLNADYARTLRFAHSLGVRYATCSGLIPSGEALGEGSRATRLSAEALTDILRDAVAAYPELKGIALRYFNPIGAHPSALIGELPRGVPQNLVPYITQTAAGVRECLSIFGDDYPTEDGSCLRDYIDIVDLAKAHVAAIGRMVEGRSAASYEIFNVGTGRAVSVFELVKTFERVNNLKLNYKVAPRRAGDVVAVWADTTLANKELNWHAERTLEQTLKSAWEWEKRVRNIE
jgi:UDP-glucose 4-epimerase